MSIAELTELMAEFGEPKFRARQVFEWISKGARPEEMTNLSKSLREKLSELKYGGAITPTTDTPGISKPFATIWVPISTCASPFAKRESIL